MKPIDIGSSAPEASRLGLGTCAMGASVNTGDDTRHAPPPPSVAAPYQQEPSPAVGARYRRAPQRRGHRHDYRCPPGQRKKDRC
jgi:hypothetical protein